MIRNYYIYKIVCKDERTNDFYIGSTSNITRRRCQHKNVCNNIKDKGYNLKIYKIIRDNGGWNNWELKVIEELKDYSKIQASIKEEEWRVKLQPKMNLIKAYQSLEDFQQTTKQHNQEYYLNNKEKEKERSKEYKNNHYDKIKEYQKEYDKNYREKNIEKIKMSLKEYYELNKEKIKQRTKEWKLNKKKSFVRCFE